MRQRALIFLAIIGLLAQVVHAQKAQVTRIAYLRYAAGLGGDCSVSVIAAPESANEAPSQVLTASCQGRQILRYVTQDALVDLFLNYPHVDRVFARWEGGSHVRFTVFKIDSQLLKASTVFDEQLEGAPDVINAPDALLVQRGKRWLSGQATSVPISTDVYLWSGDKYALAKRWKWGDGMRYEDRFCVLDPAHLTCPVTPLSLK